MVTHPKGNSALTLLIDFSVQLWRNFRLKFLFESTKSCTFVSCEVPAFNNRMLRQRNCIRFLLL